MGDEGKMTGTERSVWPRRLRGRLTVLYLVSPTLAIGLVASFAVLSYRQSQRQALLEEARTILALLVQHNPAALGSNGDSEARINEWAARISELPRRHSRIVYAAFRTAGGRDLSNGRLRVPPELAIEAEQGVVRPGLLAFYGSDPVAHASAPIGELDGAFVQIGLAIGPEWASLAQVHYIIGILAVTLLLNIWMIRSGLGRLITPLEELADTSRALAEGEDVQPVPVSGPQEIAQLSAAFNSMLARQDQDHRRIQTTLADLGEERTKLSEANRSLEELTRSLREEHTTAVFEHQRFLAMVDCLHEGLIYLGADGRVEYANPEAARLLDLELSRLSTLRVLSTLVTQGGQEPRAILNLLVGDAKWSAAQERYELDLANVAIRGDDDTMRGRMILLRDRSRERRLQRQMAEQDKIATAGMLAAGIAHEINNPLDGLQNCLRRIVKDPKNTDQIERYAGLMTASLCHIETVVKQLLNLSHKRDRIVRKIDINEVITGAIELAQAGQEGNSVGIDWQLCESSPVVLADPQNMTQVFLNLILNAVDAMPDGGTLTIVTRIEPTEKDGHDDGNILIEISDTGCGISPDVLPRIFEPFFTTKGHERGTGLGLSVSRNLVIEHGGEIDVESTLGVGTRLRIVLPRFFPACHSAVHHKKERSG